MICDLRGAIRRANYNTPIMLRQLGRLIRSNQTGEALELLEKIHRNLTMSECGQHSLGLDMEP